MKRLIPAGLAIVALLASCTLGIGSPNLDSSEISTFQKGFMSSYYAERPGSPGGYVRGLKALTPFMASGPGASRATVPVNQPSLTGSLSFPKLGTAMKIENYPEPGQTTGFTATLVSGTPVSGTKVYDVTVTTTFPSGDLRSNYVEEYYVQDIGSNGASPTAWNTGTSPDGAWTTDDPIVKKDNGVWVAGANDIYHQDPSARIKMILTFEDGSTRTETLVSSSLAGGPLLDPSGFGVADSLDFAQAFVPKITTDTSVKYSSVVTYYVSPSTSPSFWFWAGRSQRSILGIRYYTEELPAAGGTYVSHTVSFEKTLNTLVTTGGSFQNTLKTVYVGSSFDTLAESVLRQQVVYPLNADKATPDLSNGAVTTNMRTRVVNIAGKRDFYLSQMDSDSVKLSAWDTSTLYSPTASEDEILAGDSKSFVFTRTQQITPSSVSATLPFAIATTDLTGYGDLGILYTSITEETAAQSVPASSAPAALTQNANLMLSSNSVYSFGGQSYAGNSTQSTLDLSGAGTVEAWIYINQYTNTAGIVHKGVKVDFSDECFSLQGWGSSGQMAIVLDKDVAGGNTYDLVTTKTNLSRGKWYYLAATWDKTTRAINLYVNGSLSGSGMMSQTASGVRNAASDILVGSQLPSRYSSAYGYFGFDGKIVGANIKNRAMSASEVSAQYQALKSYTSNW